MSNEKVEIEFKSSLFHKKNKLIFTDDNLIFQTNSKTTLIKKEQIKAFKYGIRWVLGFEFTIGRNYCIDIQIDKSTKKIRLLSIYGSNKQIIWDKYLKIINCLDQFYFGPIVEKMMSDVLKNKTVQLGNLTVKNDGVILKKKLFVSWENIGTRNFEEYYSIYPKDNPNEYMAFNYLKDWNSGIVYGLTRWLLKKKGYWEEPGENINAKS